MKVYVVSGGESYDGGPILFVCSTLALAEKMRDQHKSTGVFFYSDDLPGWYKIEEHEVQE